MSVERAERRRPLQAILISPDEKMRAMILSGEKTLTVRQGYRDYRKGPVMLCCHLEPWSVMADITEVKHIILNEISDKEIAADGVVGGLPDFLTNLQNFYSDINFYSAVTVVRWANIRGKLVDEAKKSKRTG